MTVSPGSRLNRRPLTRLTQKSYHTIVHDTEKTRRIRERHEGQCMSNDMHCHCTVRVWSVAQHDDNRLPPPHTLIMDYTMTHIRFGSGQN